MAKFAQRLSDRGGGGDSSSVFRMERDGAITNWKCALSVSVYLLAVLGLFTCFIAFFFLFFHGIPLHSDAQYFDRTIVKSESCFLQNETQIVQKTRTAVAEYFEVSQDVTASDITDPTYLPLKYVFCGRYLLTYSPNFKKNETRPREEIVHELKNRYKKDKCIQLIDAPLNQTFSCFYNHELTRLIDPRTTAKETAVFRLQKAVSGIVGAGLLVICVPLVIVAFIFIWKVNNKYYEDRGAKFFTIMFVSIITFQLVAACMWIVLPFLGWILYPMGTYAGFLIFAVFLIIALILPVVALLLSITFRFCFRYHKKYFRVLLAISIGIIVLGIIYEIALIYPLGIKGLQKLAKFNALGN